MVNLYTSLEEAKVEIWKRWNDETLKEKVENFPGVVPEPLRNEPRAFLARHILTPDIEFFHFLELAKQVELKPLVGEFLEDKFVAANLDKLCQGRMTFFHGRENGKTITSCRKIIDLRCSENKAISRIKTLWGEDFVDFHHRILFLNSPEVEKFDMSTWYKYNRRKAIGYYYLFLIFFIRNGILFENFLMDKREGRFTTEVVIPAFEKVEEHFGFKPLIVPVIPEDEIDDIYWWCYP